MNRERAVSVIVHKVFLRADCFKSLGGKMEIADAQKDVRTVFIGGFPGQLVSSILWCASAAALTWDSYRAGVAVLILGGMFIFPLTQLLLRTMGRPHSLPKGHPFNGLAMQIAFIVPLSIPLVLAAAFYRHAWFYPAFMIVVGCHYLPFMFLYGMRMFGVLAALMIGSGWFISLYLPNPMALGGWLTAALLLFFAFMGRQVAISRTARV
jgi:hypothetical protein